MGNARVGLTAAPPQVGLTAARRRVGSTEAMSPRPDLIAAPLREGLTAMPP
jgi:hypothetical protein